MAPHSLTVFSPLNILSISVMGSLLSFTPHLVSLKVCLLPSHCLILHIPSCDLFDPHSFDWHSNPEGCQIYISCTILLSLSFRSAFNSLQDISPWASPKHPSSSCPKMNSWCFPLISFHCSSAYFRWQFHGPSNHPSKKPRS